MSFFKRLFGTTTELEARDAADRLFERSSWIDARLAYEKLAARSDASDATRAHAEARLAACADAIAEQRIEEAEHLIAGGDLALARSELESAAALARSESVRKRAARLLDGAEKRQARRAARIDVEVSDDERWAMLAGTWTDAQIDEYGAYGEAFREALLAMDGGDAKSALEPLEALAEEHAEEAAYLFAELARARSRVEDLEGSAEALRIFLERAPDDDRSETRIHAYVFLAQIAERAGDDEAAIGELQRGVDAMPDDPRPLINLGVYLRTRGEAESAVTILEAALGLYDEDQPNWPIHLEIALAKRDAGREEEAIEALEGIVRLFLARSQLDLPALVVVPLARLQEQHGNLGRAADLYATLARGSDHDNHAVYHREAGRLLKELGLRQEARRMLTRASALVDKSSEISRDIDEILSELEDEEEHA